MLKRNWKIFELHFQEKSKLFVCGVKEPKFSIGAWQKCGLKEPEHMWNLAQELAVLSPFREHEVCMITTAKEITAIDHVNAAKQRKN